MTHVAESVLESLRRGGAVKRRDHAHVDRCVACRRALGTALTPVPPSALRQRGAIVAIASVALAAAFFSIAPLRGAAFGFAEIFEPRQIAFVPIDAADTHGLGAAANLQDFGTLSEIVQAQHRETNDVRVATSLAGFRLRLPQAAGLANPAFDVASPAIEQFVFDDAVAKRNAAAGGTPYVPMPPGMDGSALRLALGPIVAAHYDRAPALVGYRSRAARIAGSGSSRRSFGTTMSDIVFVQMPVPKVGSTGLSIQQIERYLIDRPGVPQKLIDAFAALRDPTTTLPIPIPVSQDVARPVTVDGVAGTGFGDETGLGAAIVWVRGGMAYGVFGADRSSTILAIANSLQ